MAKFKDLVGHSFGSLVVTSFSHFKDGRSMFKCTCSCGGAAVVSGNNLSSGNTKTCGSSEHPRYVKHGKTHSQVYKAWVRIKQRCLNPKCDDFKMYGSKGIKISEQFLDFTVFYNELGDPPLSGKWSVDRIDNNRGYEHGNIRWSSDTQQAQHRLLKSTNKTGVTGVATRKYKDTLYFVSHWTDHKTHKNKSESFNVDRLGLIPAMYLAISSRKANILWLNTQGANYSAQHGTDRKETL